MMQYEEWRGVLSSREEETDLRISTEDGQTMSLDLGTSRENSGLDWTYTLLDLSSTENRTKSRFSLFPRELQICSIFLLLCGQQ